LATRIILLSGPVAAGKSTLAAALVERHALVHLKTQDFIRSLRGTKLDRTELQKAGESLDKKSKGDWVRDALVRELQACPENAQVVLDSVRTAEQVRGVREGFGAMVVHVHLTAPVRALQRRFASRRGKMSEPKSYESVRQDATEKRIGELEDIADVLIDTDRCLPRDVVVRVASRLGLYGHSPERLVDVLVGGQYGSEGKGNVAGYLAPEYDVLVRIGGPNAGHKVYEEPEPTTFYHLPSGTRRAPTARIVLGAGAVLWPKKLMEEIARFELGPDRLSIDPSAMIIEESDQNIEHGKLRKSIGSTAQGVGLATARKVLRTEATPPVRLAKDVPCLRPFIRDTIAQLEDVFARGQRVFLEGTQGTALSIHHGSYPHVTSRDTTVSGCLADAGIAPSRVRHTIMVCRTYPIRVQSPAGATSGPMGREISWAEVSRRSGIPVNELQRAEKTTTTRRNRRVAEFNWDLLRRAVSLNGPTDVALSFTDYLSRQNRDARRFDQLTVETIRFIEELECVASAPVSLIVTRFHFRNIIDRRSWRG
jgi:adenylosuccinate synthase